MYDITFSGEKKRKGTGQQMLAYVLSICCGIVALVIACKYMGQGLFRAESVLLGFAFGLGGFRGLIYTSPNVLLFNVAAWVYLYFRRWAEYEMAMTQCLEPLSVQIDGVVVDAGFEMHPKRNTRHKLNTQHPTAYYYVIQARKTNEALERLRKTTQATLDAQNIPVIADVDGDAVCTSGFAGRIYTEYYAMITKDAYEAYKGYRIPVTLTVYPFRIHGGVYHFQQGCRYSPEFVRQ